MWTESHEKDESQPLDHDESDELDVSVPLGERDKARFGKGGEEEGKEPERVHRPTVLLVEGGAEGSEGREGRKHRLVMGDEGFRRGGEIRIDRGSGGGEGRSTRRAIVVGGSRGGDRGVGPTGGK